MSALNDLLTKVRLLEVELKKCVLVGEAENLLKELIENLEHEVSKEAPAPPDTGSADVQTSSDLSF